MAEAVTHGLSVRRLDNGLWVVFQPDSSLPLVATHVSYHVGSAQDPPERSGLSHLFEHLFFLGSRHVGRHNFFRHLQRVGGNANGSTWYDRTTYFQTLPSEHLELALWLESDRMGFFDPAVAEEALDVQRRIVLSERRQRFDNQPYGRVHEQIHEILFPPGHPYRRPVIGSPEHLGAITAQDVSSFFQTYYGPDNAVLCLVGDFEPEPTWDLVQAYFAPLSPCRGSSRPETSDSRPYRTGLRRVIPSRVGLPRLYLSFRVPGYGERDWYAAELLSTVLTAGRSSRLHEDLVRRRQLAQDVGSFVLPTRLGATFTLAVTCRAEVQPEQAEDAVMETLRKISQEPLPRAQMQQAKDRLLTQHYRSLQTLEKRADGLARAQLYFQDPKALWKELEYYRDLEPSATARVAGDYLLPELAVSLAYVPEPELEEVEA